MRCHTPSCMNRGHFTALVSHEVGFPDYFSPEGSPKACGFCSQCWLHLLACRLLEGRPVWPGEDEVMSLDEWLKWMDKFDSAPENPKKEWADENKIVYERRASMKGCE